MNSNELLSIYIGLLSLIIGVFGLFIIFYTNSKYKYNKDKKK